MKIPSTAKQSTKNQKQNQRNKYQQQSRVSQQKQKKQISNQIICAACLFQTAIANEDYCATECKHHYHEKCLEQWLKQKNTCCLCRQEIKKYVSKTRGEVQVPARAEREFTFSLASFMAPILISSDNYVNFYFVPETDRHSNLFRSHIFVTSLRENENINELNSHLEPLFQQNNQLANFGFSRSNAIIIDDALINERNEPNDQRNISNESLQNHQIARPPSRQTKRKKIRKLNVKNTQKRMTTRSISNLTKDTLKKQRKGKRNKKNMRIKKQQHLQRHSIKASKHNKQTRKRLTRRSK